MRIRNRRIASLFILFLIAGVGSLRAAPLTVNRVTGGMTPPYTPQTPQALVNGCAPTFKNPWDLAIDSRNNVYVADTFNYVIRKITPGGQAVTLAGTGVPGSATGPGTTAQFSALEGITVDSAGNVYVTDAALKQIRKVAPDGTVSIVTTTSATPKAIHVTAAGILYYSNGHSIVRRDPDGAEVTLAGSPTMHGNVNANGAAARFNWPASVDVDAAGNVYVADSGNGQARKITPEGNVSTFAITALATEGIALRPNGNVLVSAERIYEYSPAGAILAEYGAVAVSPNSPNYFDDGPVNTVRIVGRTAVDSAGRIYVAGPGDVRVRRIENNRISTFAGNRGDAREDHGPCTARFRNHMAVAADANNIFVADAQLTRVQRDGTFTLLTRLSPPPNAQVGHAWDAATDSAGNVYVLNQHEVWRYTPTGVGTLLANGFFGAANIAVDASGAVYVSNYVYHFIWKMTSPGNVTVFAGVNGSAGSEDGAAGVGRLRNPYGIGIDGAGNLYVSDLGNATIRKIAPNGFMTTIAGTVGSPGTVDGDRNTARLNGVVDVEYDDFTGDLFVYENHPNTYTDLVRRITQTGDVETVAGQLNQPAGYADGTGSAVRFREITSITSDGLGRIYIGDGGNGSLRVAFVASSAGEAVSWTSSTYANAESAGSIPVTVQRTSSAGNMTVDLSFASGTATTPEDYVGVPVKLTLFDGELSKTYDAPLFDDARDEADETFTTTIANPTGGATLGSPATATLSINDDDAAPVVSIGNDVVLAEGDSGSTAARFTVHLSGSSAQSVSVTVTTGGGSATSGSDYTPVSTVLTFAPNEMSKVVTVNILCDTADESDETLNVTLSAPVNATLGDSSATVTIIDDDGARQLSFQSTTYTVSEGGEVTVTVLRTGNLFGTVTVDYATANGSAISGPDYAGVTGTLTFATNETSKSFTLVAFDDVDVEGNETFSVSLSNPTGGASIQNGTAVITITDQDSATVQFAPVAYTAHTTNGVVTLTVTRTGNTSSASSVNWATAEGTARNNRDFGPASGTLNFAAGETTKTIDIVIYDDRIPESRELFTVTLSAPSGTALGSATTATVTIIDDDAFANTYHDQLLGTADGDFNFDGKSDALWRNENTGQHIIWFMNGTTVTSGSAHITVPASFRMAGVADFNDDGLSDIVWYDGNAGITDIWLMNGSTRIGGNAYLTMALPWELTALGDFNADGDPDILWRNQDTGANLVWYLNGANVVSGSAYFIVDPSFWVQAVDDFNNDGYADIVWQNHFGVIDVWLMQGTTLIGSQSYAFGGGWFAVGVADFNGDGTPDILMRNLTTGTNLIWYMNGSQVAGGSAYFTVDPNFRLEFLGDFNGDFKADVAWRRIGGTTIDFWLMNGHQLLASGAYESFDATWRGVAPR